MTLTGATTIATNAIGSDGGGAHGLYASNGGTIDGSTATSVGVTTSGTGAIGVYASGSGTVSDTVTPSTITIVGAKVITNGASAAGVLADGGALATVIGGSVTTNGATAIGLEANGTSSEVDLKGAITVATGTSAAAGAAYGIYATDGGKIDGSTATGVGVTTSGTGAIEFSWPTVRTKLTRRPRFRSPARMSSQMAVPRTASLPILAASQQ